MVFLHSHGIGTGRAVRLDKTCGNEAIARGRGSRIASLSTCTGLAVRQRTRSLNGWAFPVTPSCEPRQASAMPARNVRKMGTVLWHHEELIETEATLVAAPPGCDRTHSPALWAPSDSGRANLDADEPVLLPS